MDELKKRLEAVSDTYEDFVGGILAIARKDESFPGRICEFIDNNPDAKSSDIVVFSVELDGIKPYR